MVLTIDILAAIEGAAVLATMFGIAFMVLFLVLRVWPKMLRGDEISVLPPEGMRGRPCAQRRGEQDAEAAEGSVLVIPGASAEGTDHAGSQGDWSLGGHAKGLRSSH
jgi:hypothetical protein